MNRQDSDQSGFALVAVLMLVAMVAALLGAHFLMTRADLSTTKSALDRTRGFYAAEAGLNIRAQQIRAEFEGYNRPAGTTPPDVPGSLPCAPGSQGSGEFACQNVAVGGRDVMTYVEEDASNPVSILIPPGEAYQNLNAQEYRYSVTSLAVNSDDLPEAILEMRFMSRLVPMFQFAAFYNKDLEVFPGPPMTLDGPVHANGDLYAGAGNDLVLNGQVTVAHNGSGVGGRLFNGRKYDDCCSTGNVRVNDGTSPASLPTGPGRHLVTVAEQAAWNGWIRSGVEPLTVPPPEVLDPIPGEVYWDKAEVRVVLNLDATPGDQIEVRNTDGTKNDTLTATLDGCSGAAPGGGAVGQSFSMYNHREDETIEMLEVDTEGLLNCAHANPDLFGGKAIDDTTEGGLVWYFTVEEAATPIGSVNNFGVRVSNGAELASDTTGAPEIQGLTVVTNQAVYIQGNYNSAVSNWKPAAFLADSLNVLSSSWADGAYAENSPPNAGNTAIYAAFLSGTDSTGGVELNPLIGAGKPVYNGGLENYPRFHERWSGRTLTYRGSFVSLNVARHVDGSWDDQSYNPPARDWGYDTRFNDAANLPPLSPRFVYLSQELFVREFEY